MVRKLCWIAAFAVSALVVHGGRLIAQRALSPAEAQVIAKDAYIYGYPMVQTYLTMYAFSIDKTNPQYKGPFNAPLSFARVFTPDDTAFVTPNSDTPYTFLSLDLRTEPIVLTIYKQAVDTTSHDYRAPFNVLANSSGVIKRAGIIAVPGAGFDVVPTDCLAGYVASKVEQPAWLVMALRGLQSASQGTLRTAIRQVSNPVLCRRPGAIVALKDRAPLGIDFGSGDEPCVPVSWRRCDCFS
jgi:hypothetical protein